MFGYVTASFQELTKEQKERYSAVYCGICRRIRVQTSSMARLGLRYDMAFLALLLMSLYEPEEEKGRGACHLHPISKRAWLDNEFIRYAADMNVVLAYYSCLDNWHDDGSHSAKLMAGVMEKGIPAIEERYPRQCTAIRECLENLSRLEKENCPNPDEPAGAFGRLMGELLVYREDLWASTLRQMGFWLGRFIYLLDAEQDYDRDCRRDHYNPYRAMGEGKHPEQWREYLVLAMARCTECFERLPLVQDKALLNNILYSGVWTSGRRKKKEEGPHDG